MNSPSFNLDWNEARDSMKSARTQRWFHVHKWARLARHAWVTRKCGIDSSIQEEDKLRELALGMIPKSPRDFVWEPVEEFVDYAWKCPTVLTPGQLESVAKARV